MEPLKLAIDLIQALAWPAVALYALVYFRRPLRSALELLPEKLRNVSKLTVGSLSFEVQAYLQATGDKELIQVLPELSRRAFEKILDMRVVNHFYALCSEQVRSERGEQGYTLRSDVDLQALHELEDLKLVQFTEPLAGFELFFQALPSVDRALGSAEEFFVRGDTLSADDRRRITAQRYGLTDLGRRAYDAVMTVVLRQISTK